jgi:phage terminase large subunit-like protein
MTLPIFSAEGSSTMTKRKEDLLKTLEAKVQARKSNTLKAYKPYPKQLRFHNLGDTFDERLFMAGNRVGKSFCGATEMAIHLTGRYPRWWEGRRFDRPVKAWAMSDTSLTTRDIVQTKLCGQYGDRAKQGEGTIPKECVNWDKDVSLSRGIADAYDTVHVDHASGGKSVLTFKSYEQGRKKFQGEAVDVEWWDEEPPMDVYSEGITRLAPQEMGERRGISFITFTPLLGMSDVVLRFIQHKVPTATYVQMGIEEAEHISPEERDKIVAAYPEFEQEARRTGAPMLGSGRIFPYAEATIKCDPFPVPHYWSRLWGFDFGTGHPFAAVLIAWDRDMDMIYVTHCYKVVGALPLEHWDAISPYGELVPVAWPQDGHARRDDGAGNLKALRDIYKKHGAKMLPEHAQFSDGSRSTEAGIVEMQERMRSNRFKVFSTCDQWFEEFRMYHRKDGLIVKMNDDIMSATRIAVMDRRHAKVISLDLSGNLKRSGPTMARDVDFDLFE